MTARAPALVAQPVAPAWGFAQCFGDRVTEEEQNDVDILTAVKFDHTGDFLATGDKGGRVVVFSRSDAGRGAHSRKRPLSVLSAPSSARTLSLREGGEGEWEGGSGSGSGSSGSGSMGVGGGGAHGYARGEQRAPPRACGAEFSFFAEFQSHTSEFDYLKSQEIEEKINRIAWCQRANDALLLLTTNDRTIKLWKLQERAARAAATFRNVEVGQFGGRLPVRALRVPPLAPRGDPSVHVTSRRAYHPAAHSYSINSVSTCSDGATFLSADDLRVNLWSLENDALAYNVVDLKPPSLEELNAVITGAKFHPTACAVFAYSSSQGAIKLCDLRASALCDAHAKKFERKWGGGGEEGSAAYFGDIVSQVTDLDFSRDGRLVVGRDYLTVKVWDIAMEREPLHTIAVHEHLRPRLQFLYENDLVFDKFHVSCSGDGKRVIMGTYSNGFKIVDTAAGTAHMGDLTRDAVGPGAVAAPVARPMGDEEVADENGSRAGGGTTFRPPMGDEELGKKVLHYAWHPHEDCIAVAGRSSLFIYTGK